MLLVQLIQLVGTLILQVQTTNISWDVSIDPELEATICNIDRIKLKDLNKQTFEEHILEKQPIIVQGTQNVVFQQMTSKDLMLKKFGNVSVTLSTANTISHDKVKVKFREYLESLQSQKMGRFGNESLYLFGPESELSTQFAEMIKFYRAPEFVPRDEFAFSFGIGFSGSGVPFHVHGHGFSEVLHGKKRWILFSPENQPNFDPNESSFWWLKHQYPNLSEKEKGQMLECVIQAGDLLYFPSRWWHATINIGETVFISSFATQKNDAQQIKNRLFYSEL
eukprot:TRINITY_DN28132_c0_g1_i1.p1 TRINITY_DN28132_c0_g1~~TRINITY_DN28132_c0_g1_i1.p1  ORF type:complete len:307 (-),score=17.08 TRINITY_DN28132_c0_g1_i1:155-991(-)